MVLGKKAHLISVVMCSFNSAKFLQRALDSVCGQTLDSQYYEIVFIDDGSTDESVEIVERYQQHSFFRYYRNKENRGLPFSCNKGIKNSYGEYVIRLDADDYFERDILEHFFKIVNKESFDLIYSDRFIEDEQGETKKETSLEEFDIFNLIACGVLLRKDILEKIGGYRNFLWEEYDLYIRYMEASGKKPRYVPLPLYHYVMHADNMTISKQWNEQAWHQLVQEWGSEKLEKYGKLSVKLESLNQTE